MRAGLFVALILLGPSAVAEGPQLFTIEEWREDLAYLEERIETAHINPYHTTTKESLDAAIAELNEAIPGLTDFEIAFEMQRIVASIGDGHSWLSYHELDGIRMYPFVCYWFSDGIFIIYAMPGYESLVGARIVSIDGTPIETAADACTPFISRDNEQGLLASIPRLLPIADAMHHMGVARNPDRVEIGLELAGKGLTSVPLPTVPRTDYVSWSESIEPPKDAPLYLRDQRKAFWSTILEEDNAAYIRFNAVANEEDRFFSVFARDLMEYVDESGIECLIVDARGNSGGNGDLTWSLIRRIERNDRINQRGHLYLITDRVTFSAALMLTVRMERNTNVIIVGEPGRGKPNSYSETGPFELPNSKLKGSLSELFHQEGEPDDERMMVDVELPTPLSYSDYAEQRDPALDAVLANWQQVRRGR